MDWAPPPLDHRLRTKPPDVRRHQRSSVRCERKRRLRSQGAIPRYENTFPSPFPVSQKRSTAEAARAFPVRTRKGSSWLLTRKGLFALRVWGSLRRQGRIACSGHVLAQAGGLQAGMERSGRQGEGGAERVVHVFQQAV